MIILDAGTKYIKVCRTALTADKGWKITDAQIIENSHFDYESKESYKISSVSSDLKHVLKNIKKIKDKTGAFSVNGSSILARNFAVPVLEKKELEGAVKIEAEQSISSGLKNMYFDHQTLSKIDKDTLDSLFVCANKNFINDTAQILLKNDIKPAFADVDNLALANAFKAYYPSLEGSIMLLNIGHLYTNVCLFDNGVLKFVRNVAFGGADISKSIADAYGVSFEIAEKIKCQKDMWSELGLSMTSLLRLSIPSLLESVYRSIEYCMSRKMVISVDKLVLTGGTAMLEDISDFLTDSLGAPVEKWNPLESSDIEGDVKKEFGYFMPVLLGLALRRG